MRLLTRATLFLIGVIGTSTAAADQYSTTHRLKAGDVISADILNEIFDEIEKVNRHVQIEELVGSWSCTKYMNSSYYGASDTAPTYQAADIDALWYFVSFPLSIVDDGDGTFSWASTGIDAFGPNDNCSNTGNISVFQGDFAVSFYQCIDVAKNDLLVWAYDVTRKSSSQIKFKNASSGSINLVCDKLDLPPTNPDVLTSSGSGTNVTLSWQDLSTDEVGFNVYRRDAIDKQFEKIATVPTDTVSYVDTVPGPGTYWYRVRSENANGESVGTNVIKLVIE